MAERYSQVVGQQGEELLLLRTAEQEAREARERNAELEATGACVFSSFVFPPLTDLGH